MSGSKDRLLRTGLLAEQLVQRGHDVLWWTSTVDHFHKRLFVAGEPRVHSRIGAELQFLNGVLYSKNVSLNRLRNHVEIASRFRELSAGEVRPDVILCSFPTIELSREAVRYGKSYQVPVALDVRDLWPDLFLDLLPRWIRWAGRLVLRRLFLDAKWALGRADAVYAVSQGYLAWGLGKAGRNSVPRDKVYPLAYQPGRYAAEDSEALKRKLSGLVLSDVRPIVVFVGTFGRTYDLATVLAGIRRLPLADAMNAQFVFCGAGERDSEWRVLANGLGNVHFPGWLSAGELAQLLDWADIGIAAYAEGAPQGVPNKVIEYMSAGLPVLCSLPGEARELLESNGCGVYYAAGNADSFAVALGGLLSSPALRREMGQLSKTLFEQRFSSDVVYGQMADDLEQLAKAWG